MYMIRSVLVAHLTSSILLNPLKIKRLSLIAGCLTVILVTIRNLEDLIFGMS